MILHRNPRAFRLRPGWLRALAILAAVVAQAAGAQVRGTVADTSGAPLPRATVQVWTGTRYLGQLNTDEHGTFRLRRLDADSLTLTVHRTGFQTRIVALAASDTSVRVRMEPAPVRLAPVTVASTGRRLCPNREDPRARALWTTMRGRYWQPSAAPVVAFALLENRSGTGSREEVYDPAAGERSTGWTEDALLIAHPELMVRSGYATRAQTAAWAIARRSGSIGPWTMG